MQYPAERDLIDLWANIAALHDWKKEEVRLRNEIAPRLGQWPQPLSRERLVLGGTALSTPPWAMRVYCRFVRVDVGLPTMTRWLAQNGATNFHYDIAAPSGFDTESMDEP